MRLQDRTGLLQRSQRQAEELYPVVITLPSFAPFTATRRNSAQAQALRFGGVTDSAPSVFVIDKAKLPSGFAFEPQVTTFLADGKSYRALSVDSETGEPQIRITADLANR